MIAPLLGKKSVHWLASLDLRYIGSQDGGEICSFSEHAQLKHQGETTLFEPLDHSQSNA